MGGHPLVEDAVLESREEDSPWTPELASILAHEINNPLTVLLHAAGVLSEEAELARRGDAASLDRIVAMAREVSAAASRANRNMLLMRMLARASAARPERTRLAEVAQVAITEVANDRRVPILLCVASDEHALARPELLRHVMINLLANALQALQGEPEPRVVIRIDGSGEQACLCVRDNGPGVPLEHRELIFRPHFTTRKGGTGIGLALCRRLMAQMGGVVGLVPGPGGARFYVALRRASQPVLTSL
jgi:two-component system C4-dicarboxylate transport sensor histidine kinase DctB